MELVKTTSENPDFIALIALLDADLALTDGEEHAFYDQFNKVDHIKHIVIAFINGIPVGCGALKHFDTERMEVKRMYTKPEYRGNGIASEIVAFLENWTKELGYTTCLLETGKRQLAAIALYKKCGYKIIPNYGQYCGKENSVCFEKPVGSQKNDQNTPMHA